MKIVLNRPTVEEYNYLRKKSGIGDEKPAEKVKIAINNSLFIVCLYDDKKIVGMGRIVGDKGISYAITDIMVDSYFQNKGLGSLIMKEIDRWLDANTDESSYVILIANKPADRLYERFNFVSCKDEKIGMLRKR